jgi:hypothetical protein
MFKSLLPCLLTSVAVLIGAEFLLSHGAAAQEPVGTVRLAAESPEPLGLTVEDAYGRRLLFDFGNSFRMHVTIRRHEISWVELSEEGSSETDSAQSIKLDEHRLMMSWVEESGQFVVMYVDFLEGETTFCGLQRPGIDEQGACYTGTMAVDD